MRKYLLGFTLILSLLVSALSTASSNIQREDENRSSQETGIEPQVGSAEENNGESEKENVAGRQEWFYSQRAFPFNKIPRGARERALKYVREKMRPAQAAKIQPNISGLSWQPFGPDSIPTADLGPISGRVTALAFDPNNSNIIYLGAAQGGVWKTTDFGNSWTPLTDYQPSLAVGSIAIDPTNSNVIYVGTGEGNAALDSYFGAGILKTTDGGTTWTQQGASTFQDVSIAGLAIDPTNPKIIYAAVTTGIAGVDGSPAPAPVPTGVFKTDTGGVVWTRLTSGPADAQDIKIDPTHPNTVYAAYSGKGVFRTDDGGANWNRVGVIGFPAPGQFGRVAIGLAPSNPQIIYASLEDITTRPCPTCPPTRDLLNILRSTDQGNSWGIATRPPASDFGNICQCFYDNTIAVSPFSSNLVLFGGLTLYRSTTGGSSWTDVGKTRQMHPDFHAIAFAPSSPNRVVAGNDGGVWISGDNGLSWTDINANLSITQFEHIAAHPTNGEYLIGGTQDNGTLIRRNWTIFGNGNTWQLTRGGDGGAVLIDFSNPNTLYHTFYNISFERSDDDGSSWQNKTNGLNTGDRALFYPPVAMDPSNSSTLYYGTFRLYRSIDRAENWASISGDLTNKGNGMISAIAVAPSLSSTIYVGTSDGNVQVSTDNGRTFNLRKGYLPVRYVTRIVVDPTDSNVAYVSLSGFGSGHVFSTVNGGVTWIDISGNLPNIPANALVLDTSSPNKLYVGTDIGVFVSTDGGANWFEISTGLPNSAVFDLQINNRTESLFAATHGRGVFKLVDNYNPPTITSFSPMNGTIAQSVTIQGSDFQSVASVRFNGVNASFRVDSPTQITALVPFPGSSGPISITTPNGTATSVDHFFFGQVGSGAAISSFSPMNGSIGLGVTINGTNFTGATAVRFNGVSASFTVNSLNRITAVVPFGASTGPISVTTSQNTATSIDHFYFGTVGSHPLISSFSPTSGQVGQSVTINGTNFSGALETVTDVRFNGRSTNFTVNSLNRITATVPFGAGTGPISVTTQQGTATSTSVFTGN